MWTKRAIDKKMINCHFNGLYKITCYKTKSNFFKIFFLLTTLWVFFLFSLCKFWKINKILSASFHYIQKWRKHWKRHFAKNFSNVILAFLDIWNSKFFSSANYGGRNRPPPFFKISGSAPVAIFLVTHKLH